MRKRNAWATQDSRGVAKPQRKRARCSKLVADRETVQDPQKLLQTWADHYGRLAES